MNAIFPCCEHCTHPRYIVGHAAACFPCGFTQADTERDARNVRAELRDRLDRCDDNDHGLAFGWLTDNHPDLVREALDETGAPT